MGEQNTTTGYSVRRRNNLKKVLIFCLCLAAVIVAVGAWYVISQKNKTVFLPKTYLQNTNISGMTAEEAASYIAEKYRSMPVDILEYEEVSIRGSFEDYGYHMDEEALRSYLVTLQSEQNDTYAHLLESIVVGHVYSLDIPVTFDEEQFQSYVSVANLKEERIATTDATLAMMDDFTYYVIPEVYGNTFSEPVFREYVKNNLDDFLKNKDLMEEESLEIIFPEGLYYKPITFSDDRDLIVTCEVYNQFSHAQIAYQFGSQTEVINWNQISQWVQVDLDQGIGILLEEPIRAFVSDLANRYNTRFYTRTFLTTGGYQVTFAGSQNEYGYTVNEEAEYQQLLADILTNTEVSREPVYRSTNDFGNPVYYRREGADDIAGTYVEISLGAQYLWFYVDNQLILETPLVSGSVANGTETQTGVFPLAYKESPSTLVGSNAEDGYSTEVSYWMPFYEGQGLHDATWRSSFGGSIYLTNGSHGCVNLPLDAAAQIYNNIRAGMAIIIYN